MLTRGSLIKFILLIFLLERFIQNVCCISSNSINKAKKNPKQMMHLLYFFNSSLKQFSITILSDICYTLIKILRSQNYDSYLAIPIYPTIKEDLIILKIPLIQLLFPR